MQYDTKKIELGPLPENKLEEAILETAYGRDAIADLIEDQINEYCFLAYNDGNRNHLGASEIGQDCLFALWAKFRWLFEEKFSGRMQRLFQRGHIMEPHYIAWLAAIDIHVQQVDSSTGKQYRFEAVNGHFGGSCDGIAVFGPRWGALAGKRILLECKTNRDSDFDKLKSIGVIKHLPKHYKQQCTYGKQLGLEFALYININKNNDELDVEVLALDWTIGEDDLKKAEFIILSQLPPPKISTNPSDYRCKYCPAFNVCHLGEAPLKSCRSCAAAKPIENKQWYCQMWNNVIPADFIKTGCEAWTSIILTKQ